MCILHLTFDFTVDCDSFTFIFFKIENGLFCSDNKFYYYLLIRYRNLNQFIIDRQGEKFFNIGIIGNNITKDLCLYLER